MVSHGFGKAGQDMNRGPRGTKSRGVVSLRSKVTTTTMTTTTTTRTSHPAYLVAGHDPRLDGSGVGPHWHCRV